MVAAIKGSVQEDHGIPKSSTQSPTTEGQVKVIVYGICSGGLFCSRAVATEFNVRDNFGAKEVF